MAAQRHRGRAVEQHLGEHEPDEEAGQQPAYRLRRHVLVGQRGRHIVRLRAAAPPRRAERLGRQRDAGDAQHGGRHVRGEHDVRPAGRVGGQQAARPEARTRGDRHPQVRPGRGRGHGGGVIGQAGHEHRGARRERGPDPSHRRVRPAYVAAAQLVVDGDHAQLAAGQHGGRERLGRRGVHVDPALRVGGGERGAGTGGRGAPARALNRVAQQPDRRLELRADVDLADPRELGNDRALSARAGLGRRRGARPVRPGRPGSGRDGEPAVLRAGDRALGPHGKRPGRAVADQPPEVRRRPLVDVVPRQRRYAHQNHVAVLRAVRGTAGQHDTGERQDSEHREDERPHRNLRERLSARARLGRVGRDRPH
jgi:hypothetical protein